MTPTGLVADNSNDDGGLITDALNVAEGLADLDTILFDENELTQLISDMRALADLLEQRIPKEGD